ncbi:MAG: NAD(P)-dependent oxidoreductase [Rhodobacterales bacterium]|nr:NAD(P)-dependent oxidoreductase [Rhodobacterales bacterium]NDA28932.1 NAD(P)-dependent oxidoreductase [Alphaproteobacteria bacterium]
MESRIGFVGLGLMGSAMVGRLQDCNYQLTVLGNKDRTGLDQALTRGALEAASGVDLAKQSDVIMLCMGTSDQVEERILGEQGIISGLSSGKIIIDFGTSLPSSTKEISSKIADTGAVILDAPLGRTPHHAKDGLLNIMASGDKDAFDAVRTILENLGENVFYLGDLGTGHTIKLMNNFFGMTIANAMAEVFAVADAAGVSRETVYKVISAGPLHSSMMDFISAFGLEGDKSKLEFAIKNAFKDVSYYRLMTQNLGINSIMSESASKALSQANDDGYANAMVCEMIDFFRKHYSSDRM